MHTTITTTITTEIDIDTFTPKHSVSIDAEDSGLPTDVIYAAVAGGCKATLNSIAAQAPRLADSLEEDDEDDES